MNNNHHKPIDTICFDLDGTLIEINYLFELPLLYFTLKRFFPYIPLSKFLTTFKSAVLNLLNNNSTEANYSIFAQTLLTNSSAKHLNDINLVIEQILHRDFPPLKHFFSPIPRAQETIHMAKKLGYKIILATNPVFPLQAIKVRLLGGGFDHKDFSVITHSQNMTRTKPSTEYYNELVEKFDLDPARCLMVGNDPKKDLPAYEVGMKTFMLETEKNLHKVAKLNDHRISSRGNHLSLQKLLKQSCA